MQSSGRSILWASCIYGPSPPMVLPSKGMWQEGEVEPLSAFIQETSTSYSLQWKVLHGCYWRTCIRSQRNSQPLCPSSPLRIVYIYILGEDGMGDGKGASLKTLMPCWKIALGEGFLLFRFRRSAIIRIICKPQNLLTFIKINLIIFLKNCRYWTENRWKNSSVNLYSSWNGRSFICTALLRIGPPEERKVMKEEKW